MMIKNILSTVIILVLVQTVSAQEVVSPLKYNFIQEADAMARFERLSHEVVKSRASSMELPFIDDFSTDKFPGNLDGEPEHWLDLYTFRNFTWAMNPPTLGVVTFDGADEFGYPYNFNAGNTAVPADSLTSVAINLDYAASDNIYFSFFYQGKGYGEKPENNPPIEVDSLVLEFYAPVLDQWFHAWSVVGMSMEEFEKVMIPITAEKYLHDNFQFRFANYASPLGALDHWHIDYVHLDRNRTDPEVIDDVAYRFPPRTVLSEYSSVPWKHFVQNPGAFMADNISLTAFNNNDGNRTVLERVTEVYYDGVLQGFNENTDSPPIFAQSELELVEPIAGGPFNYTFDTSVDDHSAVFDITFSHVVTPDFIPSNNTVKLRQEFYSYYAYDDGSPERGYGLDKAGASAAMRYVNHQADSLIGVAIWFEPINNEPGNNAFFPYVWADGGSGPGADLAQGLWSDVTFEPGERHWWKLFEFTDPVYIPAGGFYVGTTQSLATSLNIGLDKNSNYNPGNLYFYLPTTGYWQASTIQGTLMVRPVFQSENLGPVSVGEQELTTAKIYPNPATDILYFDPGENEFSGVAEIVDLAGNSLRSIRVAGQSSLNVSELMPGMYFVRFQSDTSGAVRTFKLLKQ